MERHQDSEQAGAWGTYLLYLLYLLIIIFIITTKSTFLLLRTMRYVMLVTLFSGGDGHVSSIRTRGMDARCSKPFTL